ncbi:MAG: InlB B-repeat-containing protein, partial [Eubacteriales bacterium]|nr:InlB B-repeat-containing protein [Eubacteriales bacterium]
MKTKLRKLLALLMTLAMFISSVPTTALAAVVPYPGGTETGSGISLRSIVKPPVATTTYVFMNGTEEFARQILKDGQTLNNPGTPDAGSANKEFTGWRDGDNNAPTFGAVTVTETKTITYHAQFADVYFVFFTNEKGEVMVTKKGANGDTISTEGVTYPVGNEQSIVGWKDASGNLVSSVTLNGSDVTLTARVENGHWITYDSQGGTYVAPAFVKGNGTTTAPAAPTRPGYTFRHWSATVGGAAFTFGNALTTALTLYAVWTPNTRTQYTVIHWQENADDDEYSYAESETKYGTTGAQTSAAAKSYTGFTAQTIAQQTIAGDGSTIVNVYYKRNVYNVQFYERKSNRWQEIPNLKITAKYQAFIGDKWPTYNGSSTWSTTSNYSWSSGLQGPYQVNIETMPLNGAKFYGPKTGSSSESAHYYVEVLPGETGETVSGRTYKLHHTDTSPGTGYSVTTEDRYPITGFTLNEKISTQLEADYNDAKFYYTRNSYDVVYINNGVTVKTTSYYYEQSISDAGSYTPARPSTLPDTFTFGGWYADPAGGQAYTFNGKTMPAQNVTVYAKWNEPTVNGTAHIKIDGTDAGTTLEGVKYGGTITEQLNALQETIMKDKTGYTWRGWRTAANGEGEPFNVDTKIYSDITLYPYYTKDGTFTVEYVSGKNNVTAPVDGKSYAEDSFADLMSPDKLVADGEYFLGWYDGTATYQPRDKYQIKSNHANQQNVITLTAQWGARPAGTTLTYKANGGAGEDVVKNLANNETVTTIANPFSRVGYTFKGWDTNPKGEGSIAPDTQVQVDNNGGENVLYAIWTANTDVSYTVHYYKQGTTDKVAADRVVTGQTFDSTVIVNAINVPGYTAVAPTKKELKLDAYNKEIIFYYTVNQYGYTIEYYFDDVLQDDLTVTGTAAYESTINYEDKCPAGYVLDKTIPDAENLPLTIGTDESANVIKVYYKKNVFTLTIKYVYEDGSKAAETHTENVEFGTAYSVTSPDIVGYTPDNSTVAGTMPASNVEVTVTYTKRSDLSYTVYYYWNGTTTPVANSKTVDKQIYNATVTESPATIGGYTAVSDETQTITIGTGENKIIFCYYKNVELTANSKLDEIYDGTVKTVSGFTGAPDDADFSAITVGAQGTDAGEYSANFDEGTVGTVDKTEKYKVTVANNGSLTINKRTVTLTSETASKEYDGTPLTKPEVAVTGDGFVAGEVSDITATGSVTFVHEGEVTNTITYTTGEKFNADNYTITKNEGKLSITQRTGEGKTITVTANSDEKVYDGAPLTNNGFTHAGALVEGDVLTAVVEGSQTDVGVGDNVVKSYKVMRGETDVTTSYTFADSVKGALTVTLRDVTFTGESKSLPYTGGMQSITGITQSGLVEGHRYEGL